MAVPRKVVKVQVHLQPLKSAKVEEGATVGAQVGVNLYDRDGTLITSLTQVIKQIAQTVYAVGATTVSWGSISGLLSSQTDLVAALAAIQSDIDAHEIAADPHPQYLTAAEGNAAYDAIGAASAAQSAAQAYAAAISPWTTAAGTADVLTANFSPDLVLTDGRLFRVRALLANATTTPTLTIDANAPFTIVKKGSQALAVGDIAGPNHELLLVCHDYFTHFEFELINPATDATGGGGGTGDAIGYSYTQAAHGFSVGMPVYQGASGWAQTDRDSDLTPCDAIVSAVVTPSGGDLYWASVVLLMLGNGTNGQATTVDSSTYAQPVTAVGGVTLSTASPIWGSASHYFDGTDDQWRVTNHASFNFGTANFCLEAEVKPTNLSAAREIFAHRHTSDNNNFWLVRVETSGYIRVYCKTAGVVVCDITTTSQPLIAATNKHVAIVRNGTLIDVYVEGVKCTLSTTTAIGASAWAWPSNLTYPVVIGAGDNSGGVSTFLGYLDDVRFTAAQRYSGASFTRPSAEAPVISAVPSQFTAVYRGRVTLTTAEWDARTGDTGGLVKGERYWTHTVAGGLTKTQPASGFAQCIGFAESATVMVFQPGPVFALAESGASSRVHLGRATASGSQTAINLPIASVLPYKELEFRGEFDNATASVAALRLFVNGATTNTDYWIQVDYAVGGSSVGANVNQADVGALPASETCSLKGRIYFDKKGRVRADIRCVTGMTSMVTYHFSWGKTVAAADVTDIAINSNIASALASGSYFDVWGWL